MEYYVQYYGIMRMYKVIAERLERYPSSVHSSSQYFYPLPSHHFKDSFAFIYCDMNKTRDWAGPVYSEERRIKCGIIFEFWEINKGVNDTRTRVPQARSSSFFFFFTIRPEAKAPAKYIHKSMHACSCSCVQYPGFVCSTAIRDEEYTEILGKSVLSW